MVIRGLSAFRPGKCDWRYLVVAALCALLQIAAADAYRGENSKSTIPEYDAADKSMRQIRIKRLKPADPESTEIMLAGRTSIDPGILQGLS